MALNLSDPTPGSGAFVGGISIDNLTWWFWVKAGIGFTFGAGLASAVGLLLWVFLILPFYLRLMFHGFR